MPRPLSKDVWESYSALLQTKGGRDVLPFPGSIEYQGRIYANVNFNLTEEILSAFREWLVKNNIDSVYHIISEGTPEEFIEYELTVSELNPDTLFEINGMNSYLIVSKKFDWAIHVDRDGGIDVAGDPNLYSVLSEFRADSKYYS